MAEHGAVQKMKVLALRSHPAEGGFKPPPAALAEDRRGERGGKGARVRVSGGDREDERKRIAAEVSLGILRWHQNQGG